MRTRAYTTAEKFEAFLDDTRNIGLLSSPNSLLKMMRLAGTATTDESVQACCEVIEDRLADGRVEFAQADVHQGFKKERLVYVCVPFYLSARAA